MRNFDYARPSSAGEAVGLVAGTPAGAFVAGGTDLLNLMKDGAQALDLVVDINGLPLTDVQMTDGLLRVGALARMVDVAAHPEVRERLPVLSEALLDSASPQVRTMASIGGNLMQRTRCWYFRDRAFACNKREPGSGCAAQEGQNGPHAILGGSAQCIAVHPSDPAVALSALDATVRTLGPDGERAVPLADLYLEPGSTPERETALAHGELITAVEVPLPAAGTRSGYLKVRGRAVVSAAAVLRLAGDTVSEVALAFGGIATRPWRSAPAEDALRGRALTDETITAAGLALVAGAQPREHNAFKVELVQRALRDLLTELGGTP